MRELAVRWCKEENEDGWSGWFHSTTGITTTRQASRRSMTYNEKKTEASKGSGPDKRGKAVSALRRPFSGHLSAPPVLIC
ncbi:unnamed protein product [Lasius platythorax]|uniref:Uncharacterized protein n=1 Tax=Lasius platythorax TaxID=488582 RepID=A0AAV2P2K1_9HYME